MELREAIEERRSIRRYKTEDIPEADLKKIIELAAWAPNAENEQPYRFVLITDRKLIKSVYRAVSDRIREIKAYPETEVVKDEFKEHIRYYTFFGRAPVLLVAVIKPFSTVVNRILEKHGVSSDSADALQSVSAAIQNIMLLAHEMGYGTCWMTGPMIAREQIERLLGITAPECAVAIIPMGLTAAPTEKLPRKPVDDIVSVL